MDLWDSIYIPQYEQIRENEFSCRRRHTKQKEEDIVICDCKLDPNDPESACGDRCLNVVTSTECTPGYCPCGASCRNQKFQNCEYAKTKLFRTEGRGWGLSADEDIKAGTFIIEYCGEIISWREARRRSQTYETMGIKDAYIISLNSMESIDATHKGSLARFINHSCWPNCETRKWTVLGEIRVGIFSKEDIPMGTELAYDYNFEWYGGAKVRCLCGAATCCGFLGAKSRGFQEDTYLWEDDDDRYSVEKIPLYDSAEDDAASRVKTESSSFVNDEDPSETVVQQSESPLGKKEKRTQKKRKKVSERQLDGKQLTKLLVFKKAKDEIFSLERKKKDATNELACLYNEIRPAIEEHERERQDSVATALAEKWIHSNCVKLKSDFDFYSFVIKTIASSSSQIG